MKIKNNIAFSESGFIFNPNSGESFTLNPSGQELFGMICDGRSEEEIREHFLDHFEVEETIFEKDYEDFLHLLHTHQMLEDDEQA
jgi:hypothetical protein